MRILFALIVLLAANTFFAASALGATISVIEKSGDRLSVQIPKNESIEFVIGQRVRVYFYRLAQTVGAQVNAVDAAKRKVGLVLDHAVEGAKERQRIEFVSVFENSLFSPVILSPAQYHQYNSAIVEATAGRSQIRSTVKYPDATETENFSGSQLGLEGLVSGDLDMPGLSLGYRRSRLSGGGEGGITRTNGMLHLGVLYYYASDLTLGFGYEYNMLDWQQGGSTVNFDLGVPVLGMAFFSPSFETGFAYRVKTKDTTTARDGSAAFDYSVTHFADLSLFGRTRLADGYFSGLSVSYMFYDKGDDPTAAEGDKKVTPGQLIKATWANEFSFEKSRLEMSLGYRGEKRPLIEDFGYAFVGAGPGIGFMVFFERLFKRNLKASVSAEAQYHTKSDDLSDLPKGESGKVKYTALRSSVALGLRYEIGRAMHEARQYSGVF